MKNLMGFVLFLLFSQYALAVYPAQLVDNEVSESQEEEQDFETPTAEDIYLLLKEKPSQPRCLSRDEETGQCLFYYLPPANAEENSEAESENSELDESIDITQALQVDVKNDLHVLYDSFKNYIENPNRGGCFTYTDANHEICTIYYVPDFRTAVPGNVLSQETACRHYEEAMRIKDTENEDLMIIFPRKGLEEELENTCRQPTPVLYKI